jgi:hypothetical protein
MRVIFDSSSLQAQYHLRDNHRLSTIITELISNQNIVIFSSLPELDDQELNNSDVLLITTRFPRNYSTDEIQIIRNFIIAGGGLLLMSNHADWPSRNLKDLRQHDAKLAVACDIGITFEPTFFRHFEDSEKTILSRKTLNKNHPIISGASSGNPVRSVLTNTCCSIDVKVGDCIVSLSSEMVDKRNQYSPDGRCFAHAIDGSLHQESKFEGRVVSLADSGFIGTDGTSYPGPGLIGHGDNLRFIINTIRWLSHDLD